jgi:bifunctional DNase/RNase
MQEMVIYGVSFDMVGKSPIVLLKTAEGNRFLPIWIGHAEAAAILMKLQGQAAPRPMTHDLVTDMLAQLDANVARVTVTELRESTFYALVTVRADGHEIEVDSRPSDAIALALRAEAPIFVAERVLEESGIEFDEGEESGELPPELPGELSDEHLALVERWREQLEGISSAEDFTDAASEEDDDLS